MDWQQYYDLFLGKVTKLVDQFEFDNSCKSVVRYFEGPVGISSVFQLLFTLCNNSLTDRAPLCFCDLSTICTSTFCPKNGNSATILRNKNSSGNTYSIIIIIVFWPPKHRPFSAQPKQNDRCNSFIHVLYKYKLNQISEEERSLAQ